MTLSSNVHYTLVATTILATKQPRSGPLYRAPSIKLTELHRTMGLSVPYLAQLFQRLRDAGLVVARRGPKGGYRLAHRASDITLGSVARAVETNGVNGVGGKPKELCDQLNGCFDAFLDTITLGDVVATRLAEGGWLREDVSDTLGRRNDGTFGLGGQHGALRAQKEKDKW